MTKFQDRTPPGENGVMERLQALEREVQELRAARRLEASTIGKGGITVQGGAIILKDATGHEIARMGVRNDLPGDVDGTPQSGFIIRRNDGTVAFTVDDPNGGVGGLQQFVKINDALGHTILAEDANGFGLGVPYLEHSFAHSRPADWPTSVSATFEALFYSSIGSWNPLVQVSFWGYTDGTATGELDLRVNGVSQGVRSLGAVTWTQQTWTLDAKALSGNSPDNSLNVELFARRVAGTGNVKAEPVYAYGSGT
jgi:hypothetical protein